MAHYYTEAEEAAWLKQLPKKVLSAKVLLYNPAGQVVIIKPNYKPGWHFVGGMIDAGESPLAAVIREAKEEVGLELSPEMLHFNGVRYGIGKSGDDYVHFVFSAVLTEAQAASAAIVDEENEDLAWTDLHKTEYDIQDKVVELVRTLKGQAYQAAYSDEDRTIIGS
jgi:8-oxo-dGTP pyrophosphatase MutT (NUDIX family)